MSTTARQPVATEDRYSASQSCPICGGHERIARGRGERCTGYYTHDRSACFCSREEHGGRLARADGLYRHWLGGVCDCGVDHRDVIDRPAPKPRAKRKRSEKPARELVYDYTGPDGETLLQVVRKEYPDGSKDIVQRMPIADRPEMFVWSIKQVPRPLPLYRLVELREQSDPETPLLVVEGEPHADRLIDLGFLATTSVMGAGKAGETDWSIARGLDVVLMPDNDKAGRDHTADVARRCREAGAARVRLLELPGLAEKGDILDWLAAGGTAEDLRSLVESAPEVQPTASPQEPAAVAVAPDAWRLDARKASEYRIRPLKFLSKPRLPRGIVITLGGAGGEGKSTLTEQVAADLSTNRPTLGSDAPFGEPVDVLMLACEDGREDALIPRLVAAGADLDRIEIVEGLRNAKGDRLPFDITSVEYLRRYIEEGNASGRNFKLVVVDPVTTYVGRAKIDDHRDAQLKPALEGLSSIAQDLDVTFVCLAHLNKGGGGKSAAYRIMGGAAYVTSSRLAYVYAADPDDSGRRILASPKANIPGGKPPSLAVRIRPVDPAEAASMLAPHVGHLSEDDRLELTGQLYRLSFDGPVERSAEEVLDQGINSKSDRKERALDFLREALDGGKFVASNTVYAEGKKRGISRSAIWDAKAELDITPCKVTENGVTAWFWKLDNPDEVAF